MKTALKITGILLLIILSFVVYTNYPKLDIITGFASKNVCSCTFIAQRDLTSIESQDNDFSPVFYTKNNINYKNKSVTSTLFGLNPRTAVYKEGLGCILLPENSSAQQISLKPKRNFKPNTAPFPYGDEAQKDTIFKNIDYKQLDKAVNNAFDAPNEKQKRTRALLVIYKDHIIAEKYADGFNKDTKILGWSMTKSITSAIVGVLEKQGKVNRNQFHLFKSWDEDQRAEITLNNLLQMNSGLEWTEDYNAISDVTKMLYQAPDMPKIQLEKPLINKPNQHWNYSSGTTNLISAFIANQFKNKQDYLDFWYTELIDKIGMHSMVIETDFEANFIGSSYGWATARDWSKFGLLYLHNGIWNGEEILTKAWINYTTTPTNTSDGIYGAQFWLNAGGQFPDLPKDLYSCNGFQGQKVSIIPSKETVIVRFGLTEAPEFDFNVMLSGILKAIK
ncbi:serine hydrolase domain-containing protein [Formosa sp. S-31]|uniref:serine hydrolase domain-containing protein n=1 Tax=Formosa sp. S-31 TaxID=2790949 RepID=UPI003EB7CC70